MSAQSGDASSGAATGDDDLSLEEFYEHAPCGYCSLRPDGTIVRVNDTLLAWTGHQRADLLSGMRFSSLLTVGSQIFYETRCAPLLLAGQPVEQVALDLRGATGAPLGVLFAAAVHARGDDPAATVIRVTLVDVSQRRSFEQQLVALNDRLAMSNEEYETFTQAAAHDLRAPLRGIRQYTEFFLEDNDELLAAGDTAHLQTAVRLAGRMNDMLDALLAYAQIGRSAWEPRPTSLRAVVSEVVDLLGTRLRGATLTTADEVVDVDPAALRQLLLNLIGNAAKYSAEDPVIQVTTCTLHEAATHSLPPATLTGASPDAQVVAVSDRGIGIDPALQDRVFDLFRQIDTSADGSGSGLALCRLICRRHGGDIWLESEFGKGSTFYALLRPDVG